MSKFDVSVNQYLARTAQSLEGGKRLGPDFWVAVRDLVRYEPPAGLYGSYCPSNEKVKRNEKHLNRLAAQGLTDAVDSSQAIRASAFAWSAVQTMAEDGEKVISEERLTSLKESIRELIAEI